MRILTGILLLLTALLDLFAGLTYVAGGALTAGLMAGLTDVAGQMAGQMGVESGAALEPSAMSGLDAARGQGIAIGGGIFAFGIYLMVTALVLLVAMVLVFKRSRPKVVYAAGGMAVAGEVGGILLTSFGITNAIGLVAGALAILTARGFDSSPAAKPAPKKPAAPAASPARAAKVPLGVPDFALIALVVLGAALMGGAGYLYLENDSASPGGAVAAVTAPRPSPDPAPQSAKATNAAKADAVAPTGGSPATGAVRGQPFTVEDAVLENGVLTLRQGEDFFADASFDVFLFLDDKELPEGRRFDVGARSEGMHPHVYVSLKPADQNAPEQESFTQGYTMTLEFGQREGITLPGKIRLEVPDESGSHVEGIFTATIKGWAEILSPDEYTPDLTQDSFDILKYLARSHLEENHPDSEVEVLTYSDASYGSFGENGGSGKLLTEYRVGDGEPTELGFEFEKDADGWHVSKTSGT